MFDGPFQRAGHMNDETVIIDGFRCYAPVLAQSSEDYPADAYDRLCRLEEQHFWFRARNRIILGMFRQYVAQLGDPHVLEVGCGTGYVLQGLAKENRYRLMGAEAHIAGLRHARNRLPDVEFVQLDARQLPYESVFDAVGAFDVIEHITEDHGVLASIFRALKPGGVIIVTVPQHQWLWSTIDEHAGHKRRYSRRDLLMKLATAGFELLRVTSFVTALLPVLFASRFGKRRAAAVAPADWSELEISPAANAVGSVGMRIDETLIRAGISLPAGGSLLAVARKKEH
jgi:SAM-dependent methyltransferase